MMTYILEVSLCWMGFYAIYALLLSKETFFQLNRVYLIATALLSLAIPLLEINLTPEQALGLGAYYLQPVTIGAEDAITVIPEQAPDKSLSLLSILVWVYWLGFTICGSRFLFGLFQLQRHMKGGEITRLKNYSLIITNSQHVPFSFFKNLFWSRSFQVSAEEKRSIFRHEEAHIYQWHSLDVVLLEILAVIFWCSPVIYLYKTSMKAVHEYLADAYALQTTDKKQYGHLLLRQSLSGPRIALMNSLFNSQLKKRIVMMTRNKSNRQQIWKYALLLPMLLLTTIFFSAKMVDPGFDPVVLKKQLTEKVAPHAYQAAFFQTVNSYVEKYPDHLKEIWTIQDEIARKNNFTVKWESPEKSALIQVLNNFGIPHEGAGEEEVFKLVEELPIFAGCEEMEGDERKACSDKKLLEFIYQNLQYPKEAKESGIEGMVVVSFIIEKDGSVSNAKIVRSIGGGCDQEVLRITGLMPNWVPGKQRGRNVRVQFNLPIKFKLEDSVQKPASPAEKSSVKMPLFAGCENAEDYGKCSNERLFQFISENMKYPEDAKKAGIEGVVHIKFTVGKDGTVRDAEVVKGIHKSCDEEALRVVKAMPAWNNGQINEVSLVLPFSFKMSDNDKKAYGAPANKTGQLNAFPNPAKDNVTVEFLAGPGTVVLSMVDYSGREVFKQVFKEYDGAVKKINGIDISKTAKGNLVITLADEKGNILHTTQVSVQ